MLSLQAQAQTQESALRGLRIDTSYFYNMYPGLTPAQAANEVVTKAKASGVNTLFVYAYNSVYGALYPTTYSLTIVENGYGKQNILKELTTAAKSNGLKVVAVVPVNNFKNVWDANPLWRAKSKDGSDYVPAADHHLLSAWHPDFKAWLKGFYEDLISKNPEIDGIEAVEPMIDYRWAKESDYNPVATQNFLAAYPTGQLGDQNWLNFRAQGLTNLVGILTSVAATANKKSYLVQTWPAKPDGTLFSADVIKDNIGLDLNAVLNFTGANKLTYLMCEFMWQQWAAEYGPANFSIAWTKSAATTFINFVGARSTPIIHVEISPFAGAFTNITPTAMELQNTLLAIKDLKVGIDVYDFYQIFKLNAWTQLSAWGSAIAPAPIPVPVVSCVSTTRTITSPANTAGVTQSCIAKLPASAPSATAITASVSKNGSYSLVCLNTGAWSAVPKTSICPAPSVKQKRYRRYNR